MPELYTHLDTQNQTPAAPSCWLLKEDREEWLQGLRPIRLLFWQIPSAKFVNYTTKRAQVFYGDAKLYLPEPKPPAIRVARKADILLLKLAWGGRP
jgi:hypothetical protein